MNNKNITISFTPGTIVFVLLIATLGWFLYSIKDLIPIILSAVIFSLALAPSKRFLERLKIPGPISVVLLYIFVFGIFSFFVYSLLPVVAQQYSVFIESLPNILTSIEEFFKDTWFENLINQSNLSQFQERNSEQIVQTGKNFLTLTGQGVSAIFGSLVDLTLFLLLTFILTVKPAILDNTMHALTPLKYRGYVDDLWKRSKTKMALWFKGQIILVLVIGSLTYLALVIIGLPNALLLGIFAGLMELLPIFGPFLAAIPAILVAFTTKDLGLVLIVLFIYFIIQQLENNLIYPLVVSNVVGVPSILILLAIVVGSTLVGFVGVVIAVPLAGVLQEFFNDIYHGKISKLLEDSKGEYGTAR